MILEVSVLLGRLMLWTKPGWISPGDPDVPVNQALCPHPRCALTANVASDGLSGGVPTTRLVSQKHLSRIMWTARLPSRTRGRVAMCGRTPLRGGSLPGCRYLSAPVDKYRS